MGIPRSETLLSRLVKQPGFYDIILGIGSGSVAIATAKVSWAPYVLGAVCLASITKGIVGIRKTWKEESAHELEGCLHLIHAYLLSRQDPKSTVIRLTIHVPVDDQTLEQIMEYVGATPNKRKGRKFPSQSGIVGYAYRLKEPTLFIRENDDYEKYVKELKEEWNYTDADARSCSPSTFSGLAIPLLAGDDNSAEVEGIVFIDSNQKNLFLDDQGKPTPAENCIAMCSGIARFIRSRY